MGAKRRDDARLILRFFLMHVEDEHTHEIKAGEHKHQREAGEDRDALLYVHIQEEPLWLILDLYGLALNSVIIVRAR